MSDYSAEPTCTTTCTLTIPYPTGNDVRSRSRRHAMNVRAKRRILRQPITAYEWCIAVWLLSKGRRRVIHKGG